MLGIDRDDEPEHPPLLTPDQRRLLDALGDQAAVAIERVNLAADVDRTRLLAETERLRSALLTSISHDLRTPLASILGAASGLESYHALLDEAAQHELLLTIREEAERLNRFVGNLLDMTRLESGALAPEAGGGRSRRVVGAALARAGGCSPGHRVAIDLAPGPADAEPRCRAVRAGAVQPARQRREIRPEGSTVRLRAWHEAAADGPGWCGWR